MNRRNREEPQCPSRAHSSSFQNETATEVRWNASLLSREPSGNLILPEDLRDPAGSDEATLNLVMVYDDASAHYRAFHPRNGGAQPSGENHSWTSCWEIGQLGKPLLLAKAVQDAAKADVIVIAVRAAKVLPLDLYVWVTAWLPRRQYRPGTLIALIGVSPTSRIRPFHTREYLESVARKGRLHFHAEDWA
jgi:hypothetical protein